MKTPDELKGKEVKKLENFVNAYLIKFYFTPANIVKQGFQYIAKASKQNALQLNTILDFYRRDFTPDMIEKYFEGWEYENYFYRNMKQKATISFSYTENKFHSMWISNIPTQIEPHTLSDFIDACLNSEIKLKWRE